MNIFKNALSRRTLLRGTGAAFALPLLDAMVPAMTARAASPASNEQLRRIGYIYIPMGCNSRSGFPQVIRWMFCRRVCRRSRI